MSRDATDDARSWVRHHAREGDDAQTLFDDLRVRFALPTDEAHEIVSIELRSVQEEQIRSNHDRLVIEALDREGV